MDRPDRGRDPRRRRAAPRRDGAGPRRGGRRSSDPRPQRPDAAAARRDARLWHHDVDPAPGSGTLEPGNLLETPPSNEDAQARNRVGAPTEDAMRIAVATFALVAAFSLPAFAADQVEKAPPSGAYKKVSELVKLPDFPPGL